MTISDADREVIFGIDRPHSKLLIRYMISSIWLGPLFFVALLPAVIRYSTLRYRFDSEGVAMRWGLLFRREINLTYRRIQDIHLSSGVIDRWLGLARIEIQTASGSSGAEMVIEGLLQFEQIRDFLYDNMRGTQGKRPGQAPPRTVGSLDSATVQELTRTLQGAANDLRLIREKLTGSPAPPEDDRDG